MSDFARLEQALENAAKANDVAAASQIASEMRRMLQAVNPSVGVPDASEVEAARMAAEGTSGTEAAMIAAGRTVDKLGAGIEQVGRNAVSKITGNPPQGLEQLAEEQRAKDVAFGGLQRNNPVASAAGGMLPYMALPASMGIVPAAGAVGVLEAAQYGTPQERVQRGLLGGGSALIGGAVGKGLGAAIAPVRQGAVSETRAAALQAGQRLGVQPRLSEVTGRPFFARMEDMASRIPGGAGVMDDFARGNATALNRAAARSIGETADELSPKMFAGAADRMGKVFEDLKALPGKPIQITKDVAKVADDVLRQHAKMIPQQQDANLAALAQQAKQLAANKGRIDGEAYQLLRSGLSDAAFDATGTNKALYGKFLSAIDNAAEQSLKSAGYDDLAAALRTVRPQYKNLKTLERGLVAEGGDVSPARVAQVLRQQNPAAFREGRMAGNPLNDIATFGETFKPLRQGSQTMEREVSGDLLSLALKSPWAYGWAKATTSPVMTAYPGLLSRNPQAALMAGQAASLSAPVTRGATMGLLNSYFQ